MSKPNVKPGHEKFDAPASKPTIAEDGAPVQDADVQVVPGQVTRIERPKPLEPEPSPKYLKDTHFGG